ncbi:MULTISPECIES: hypothetical protein [Ochrobactrum]|uniref:Secreted protein n=1 Tax=Ochrobactrum chromiisoli TaxID=2993941 RepID=A0ABT3QPM4_9HYPH|nr:hypothetical protein [Ochrobactrum chromiisoli]MCX2697559.1 hypothetical protein [Ochrobactrum chromiisoli]
MRKTVYLAFPVLTIMMLSSVTALAQANADPAYLERRNDQGIVAYCSNLGFLEPDSEEFFHVGTEEIFGEVESSAEADVHEQKGREGISYLQGDEQSLSDLAAANDVDVKTVCAQYKSQVTLGRMMKKNKESQ